MNGCDCYGTADRSVKATGSLCYTSLGNRDSAAQKVCAKSSKIGTYIDSTTLADFNGASGDLSRTGLRRVLGKCWVVRNRRLYSLSWSQTIEGSDAKIR